MRASNSSLLRVSPADISLQTPAIVLLSSSPPTLLTAADNDDDNAALEIDAAAPWSRLGLDGGALAVNATESVVLETPGAFLRVLGRRCDGGNISGGFGGPSDRPASSSGRANGDIYGEGGLRMNGGLGLGLGLGEFVADADAVLLRARSPSAGVSIVADGAESRVGMAKAGAAAVFEAAAADGWGDGGGHEAIEGGRLEVRASSGFMRRRQCQFGAASSKTRLVSLLVLLFLFVVVVLLPLFSSSAAV